MILRRLNWKRTAAAITIAGLCQFVVFSTVAMILYPGGHAWDTDTDGYAFWRNTLSDLGRTLSVCGEENAVGSAIFNTSMIVVTVSLLPVWFVIPSLFAAQRSVGLSMRLAGLVFSGGMIAIALTPADVSSWGHKTSIAVMGTAAHVGIVLCCVGLMRAGRSLRFYGLATLVLLALALVHFSQFVWHFYLGGEWTKAAPFCQKLLTIWVVFWTLTISAKVWRSA